MYAEVRLPAIDKENTCGLLDTHRLILLRRIGIRRGTISIPVSRFMIAASENKT
jgi:hypothetical protein